MSAQSTECTSEPRICNNYFDGLTVTGFHKVVFFIIMMAYFFEQMDNWNFGFIAPAIFKSWGLTPAQANDAMKNVLFWYFLGMTMGGLLGGIISDIIGRRKTFLFSILLFSTGSLINALPIDEIQNSPIDHMYVFIAARALTGFGVFCLMVCSQAYIAEMAPADSRGKWQGLVAAVGFCAVPVIAFLCRVIVPLSPEAWRWIFALGGLGYAGFFIAVKWLKESPRWLVAQGRIHEAEEIVRVVAHKDIDLSEAAKCCAPRQNALECIYGMFTSRYIVRTIVLLLCFMFTVPPAFIFTSWTAKMLAAIPAFDAAGAPLLDAAGKAKMLYDQATMLTIMTLISIGVPTGCLFASVIADKGGRKWPMLFCYVGCAICAVLFSQFAHVSWEIAAAIGFIFSVFSMSSSFMLFSYTAENYPTRIRNTATGLHNAVARFSVSGSQFLVPMILGTFGGVVGGISHDMPALFTACAISFLIPLPILAVLGAKTSGKSLEDIS